MSDAAYDVALGVLRGFTMGEEVGSQALAVVESQNQALQEALEAVRVECTCGLRVQHIDEHGNTDYGTSMGCAARDIADRALSPTQETDPE